MQGTSEGFLPSTAQSNRCVRAPCAQGVAGGAAGGVAAALTTPLDVVKTRLQLEGVGSPARHLSANAVGFWLGFTRSGELPNRRPLK